MVGAVVGKVMAEARTPSSDRPASTLKIAVTSGMAALARAEQAAQDHQPAEDDDPRPPRGKGTQPLQRPIHLPRRHSSGQPAKVARPPVTRTAPCGREPYAGDFTGTAPEYQGDQSATYFRYQARPGEARFTS